jgi:penicillin-binding protein 1B
VLAAGQKLSKAQLVNVLRRAGYIESPASDVWSGSFFQKDSAVEIRPSRTNKRQPNVITVGFTGDQLSSLTGDSLILNSFTLEPEALSNDVSSKAGKRELLAYDQIPPLMIQAVLAIEDRRFFEHSGVDFSGLVRAALRNAGEERISQGGSTITQQLVKNTYLSPERTIQRKYAEAMLALALERRLSKEDIFALYCNEVYLGQRGAIAVRGIKEAAEVFFGKDLQKLSLGEAATIAGMIQGPTRYSPLRHAEATKERRNIVLQSMLREGFITSDQANNASAEPIVVAPPRAGDASLAPYFVDYVNRIAETEFDASGLSQRIYITIDL